MSFEKKKLELIEWGLNLNNEKVLKALNEIKDSNLRGELGKRLEKELKLTSSESQSVLSDFEKLEDEG